MPRLILVTLVNAVLAIAQPAASLSGRVADLHDLPVVKVTLQLKPVGKAPDIDPRAWRVQSGEHGEFLFEGIDPGSYVLSASKPGYLAFTFGATKGNPSAQLLHLAAGKPHEGLAIQLTPSAAVAGKVLDDDGDPLSAFIVISKERYEDGVRKLVDVSGAYAEADGDGSYRISALEAGRYFVAARAPGPVIPFQGGGYGTTSGAVFAAVPVNAAARPGITKSDYATTFYPNTTDYRDAKAIELAAGQDLSGIDIRMRKAEVFRVRGQIQGVIPGHPADQYRVVLRAVGRTTGVGGDLPPNVHPDGSFEIDGLPPGDYDLSIASGGLNIDAPLAVQKIAVSNHDTEGIVIALRAPGSFSGSIIGANARPLGSIAVTLTSIEGPSVKLQSTPAKEDGVFRLADIPPGRYRVMVTGNPAGTYLQSVKISDSDAAEFVVQVDPGASLDQARLLLGPAGRVQGSASARNTITLIPDPQRPDRPDWYKQVVAGDDGHFELTGITPGTYRVFSWSDIEPGEWFDSAFLKPHLNQSVPVIIRQGATAEIALTEIATR